MRQRKILEETGWALLCLAIPFFFFHAAFFPRTGTFLSHYDNTYQYYAWMHKLASDWRALSAPLWDFSVEAGIPFPGEIQTAAFYPINILYVWFSGVPSPAKLDFLILLHFGGGMWGASMFLRQRGINHWASLFGAAIFCLVGPVAARAPGQANIFTGLVYLPWILYFFDRAISTGKPIFRNPWAGLCGLALAFSLLAGHPQPFIHNGCALILFAVFSVLDRGADGEPWKTVVLRLVAILGGVAVVCFLFAFIQLAAAHEYFARAYRWIGLADPIKALQVVPLAAYDLYKLSPSDLVSVFRPHTVRDSGSLFVTITALVCACFGMAFPGRVRWFALSTSILVLLVALGSSTAVGSMIYHMPVLNRVREPSRIVYLYQFCVAFLAAAGLHVATGAMRGWRLRTAISLFVSMVFIGEARWNAAAPKLGSINDPITASQAYRKTPLLSRLESENSLGVTPRRVLARPKDLIPPNSGDVFHINTLLGHRSSMLIGFFDLLSKDWSVSSAGLDQLGVRYLLTDTPAAGFPVLMIEGKKTLYERTSAQPILRLESDSGGVSDEGISQVAWRRNGVSLRVQAKDRTRLVFAESAFPGWSVRVNGAHTALEQKGPFMSVSLPPGDSAIEWSYRPWWFLPGMLGWLIGAALLIHAALPDRWRSSLSLSLAGAAHRKTTSVRARAM